MSWVKLTSCSYLEFQLTHYCVISLLWYKQCTPQANMIFCYSEKQSLNCQPMGFLMTTTNILVFSKHILVRHCLTTANTHTHTHTRAFNGPFSGTTQVSRYQTGKSNLDFTEAIDSEWQWHQLGHMQVCTSLQTDNHASTPPLSVLQAGCPSCCPTNSVKALKAWQEP